MNRKLTPIASAVAVLMFGTSVAAQAQTAAPAADAPVTQVEVVGVRAALQASLKQKRDAVQDVEVITAEDVGKMPDKNVADALQRVPGVNTASGAAGEGGFDENDRVSIRGTSPSLTQVTFNGHAVSTGDWFLTDEWQTIGRSVSFTLLPSELVSSVVVYKTPTADQTEGGVSGSVDVLTHTPLQFKDSFTAEATVGAVYATLPKKTDPQFNGLISWKNDEKTFGVTLEAFDEKRSVERYGQEVLGYQILSATGTGAAVVAAHPDLNGVAAPSYIGSALFNQTRERKGGDFAIEVKPTRDLSFNLNGFLSHMDANNSNINFLANVAAPGGVGGFLANGSQPSNYTVQNGTLTAATFTTADAAAAVVDNIYRVADSSSKYLDLDGKYRVNDRLIVTGKVGTTTGIGNTKSSDSWEANVPGTLTYQMHGTSAASVSFPSGVPFSAATTGYLWTDVVTATDKENYGQLDGLLSMDAGPLESIKFGARFAQHTHQVAFPVDGGPLGGAYTNTPAYSGTTYPSNFGSVLGNGVYSQGFVVTQQSVTDFYNTYGKTGASRQYWPGEEYVSEKDEAGYAMGNLSGKDWTGNVGVRLVHTVENVVADETQPGANLQLDPGDVPGTITTSAFGNFVQVPIDHSYNNFLPSANLKLDLTKDLVARFSVANTMARADYAALGGAVALTDALLSGTGGNPDLKPIRATNWDSTLEWYFAPKSLVSASLFYMDFQSYVDFGVTQQVWPDQLLKGVPQTYAITSPFNTSAKNDGIEVSYQQGFNNGFGVLTNFTLANGHTEDGSAMVGNSKDTANLTGYYEGHGFSARLAYTYRSSSLVGLDRSFAESEKGVGNLALALNYEITPKLSVSLNALNLNNAPLVYYANNETQLRGIYYNGSQYYLTLHGKY